MLCVRSDKVGRDLRLVRFKLAAEHLDVGRKMMKRVTAAVHRRKGMSVFDPFDEAFLVRQRKVAGGIGENHEVDLAGCEIRWAQLFKTCRDGRVELRLRSLG